MDSRNEQNLEQFIQDLILNVDRPEQVGLLLEILQEIHHSKNEPAQKRVSRPARVEAHRDRYDIFKMYPDRIVRIGFVKGVENAKRVLPSLNSLGESVYFLHDSTLG
ncbi:MAG TPA: hypothetical protein VEJ38_10260 [Candidatus Acidoferrales bacterium]|nr:hypothetical protein [Candidatus Acidoferrales bacterium]